jgi:hypothetical protein
MLRATALQHPKSDSTTPVPEHTKVVAMRKKTRWLPGILVCMLAMGFPAQAAAGEVKLVSDTIDKVCRVEVTSGSDAPNAAVETYTDVEKGWSITKPDKLCYRRASTPDNCDSGMTQWNTRWRCAEKAESGIEELSLK